jgi:hypothetical protein
MKSRKDFFQTINSFPHSLAIYCTFTLDKEVIDKIAESSSYSNIIILHDYRQGVSLKNNWDNRVVCIPVSTPSQHQQNCFHSKLALLKGNDKAKLLLGSANLSKDSFSKEKEICFEVELEFSSDFYNHIVSYIESLIPQTYTSTEVLTTAINKLRYSNQKLKRQTELSLVHPTITDSISDSLRKHIHQEEQPILRITSPYLSADYRSDLGAFIEEVNPKEIHLFLRKNYPIPSELRTFQELKLFQPKPRNIRNGFHAKLLSVEYSSKEIVFIGSANFSRQGFFLDLQHGANQECGVIISSKDKHIVDDWFNEGWEKPVALDDWQEDEKLLEVNEEEFHIEPYAWAERKNSDKVSLLFFIPEGNLVHKVSVGGRKIRVEPKFVERNIFQFSCILKGESILIEIGDLYKEEITIFNECAFEAKANENGEGLFLTSAGIDSTNPLELQDAINREGIKLKTSAGVIVEPPFLEQYFYNVKNKLAKLETRKFFSDFHAQELQKVLSEEISGGAGMYYASQLLKCFEKKEQYNLADMCRTRIQGLLSKEDGLINYQSFGAFYKTWKKY